MKKSYENWTKEETLALIKQRAEDAVAKHERIQAGKKFRLVKVSNTPATWKEVEVKN
ncbi:MAG: hypothetical protein HN347_01080 [Bacteroidetes bacterium]|jgi:hypothetical protein|nr:hypothetical protein [Bacteroidota bacterium]